MGILSQATHQLKANKRNDSREILVLDPMNYLAYNKNTAKAWRDKNMDAEAGCTFQLISNENLDMKQNISDMKEDVSCLNWKGTTPSNLLDREVIPVLRMMVKNYSLLSQMKENLERIKDSQERMDRQLDYLLNNLK